MDAKKTSLPLHLIPFTACKGIIGHLYSNQQQYTHYNLGSKLSRLLKFIIQIIIRPFIILITIIKQESNNALIRPVWRGSSRLSEARRSHTQAANLMAFSDPHVFQSRFFSSYNILQQPCSLGLQVVLFQPTNNIFLSQQISQQYFQPWCEIFLQNS